MEKRKIESFEDLLVWQKGIALVKQVYLLTDFLFPLSPLFAIYPFLRSPPSPSPARAFPSPVWSVKTALASQFRSWGMDRYAALHTRLFVCHSNTVNVAKLFKQQQPRTERRPCAYFVNVDGGHQNRPL